MDTSRKKEKVRRLFYLIGGVVLAAGMFCLMPEIIRSGSDYLYKKKKKAIKRQEEDDWGPEIVKKELCEGSSKDGEF